jgi:hypothetical protein
MAATHKTHKVVDAPVGKGLSVKDLEPRGARAPGARELAAIRVLGYGV